MILYIDYLLFEAQALIVWGFIILSSILFLLWQKALNAVFIFFLFFIKFDLVISEFDLHFLMNRL